MDYRNFNKTDRGTDDRHLSRGKVKRSAATYEPRAGVAGKICRVFHGRGLSNDLQGQGENTSKDLIRGARSTAAKNRGREKKYLQRSVEPCRNTLSEALEKGAK